METANQQILVDASTVCLTHTHMHTHTCTLTHTPPLLVYCNAPAVVSTQAPGETEREKCEEKERAGGQRKEREKERGERDQQKGERETHRHTGSLLLWTDSPPSFLHLSPVSIDQSDTFFNTPSSIALAI